MLGEAPPRFASTFHDKPSTLLHREAPTPAPTFHPTPPPSVRLIPLSSQLLKSQTKPRLPSTPITGIKSPSTPTQKSTNPRRSIRLIGVLCTYAYRLIPPSSSIGSLLSHRPKSASYARNGASVSPLGP